MKRISSQPILNLLILGMILEVMLSGCSQMRAGKVNLAAGIPRFLKVGETTPKEVWERIGEPLGYRERGSRSAMSYVDYRENYIFLLITGIRDEKVHRLDLVFQDGILEKAEVKREGWGFEADVNLSLLESIDRQVLQSN